MDRCNASMAKASTESGLQGALGSLFGFHALLLASSKVAFQMVVLIQSVCSADGPKGEACVEVVESQDATMEGEASDQVVPAVDSQGLDVSNGEIVSPLLSLAEPEPHAFSPSLECAPAPECVSVAPLPPPENLSNGGAVVVDDGSDGEGSGEESQAKMMEVESLNLDMFHVSGESEEETVDFLRRRDQQTAMKEDAPPRKGKGRGKGKGKGRGRGKKQQKGDYEEEEVFPEETVDKPAGKSKKSNGRLEGKGKVEKVKAEKKSKGEKKSKAEKVGEEPGVTGKATKRKAKALEEKKEQSAAPKVRKPRQANKKAKANPATSAASAPEPAPDAVPDVCHCLFEAGPLGAPDVPPDAPAPNPKPRQQGTRVPEKTKKQLIPSIKSYSHSYVVPYWSRSAVGLKVRNASGSLSQAGLVYCVCVCCSFWCRKTFRFVFVVCKSCSIYEVQVR